MPIDLFVTEETQFCVNGGLHTDLNQCNRGSYANPLYVVQEGPDTMSRGIRSLVYLMRTPKLIRVRMMPRQAMQTVMIAKIVPH